MAVTEGFPGFPQTFSPDVRAVTEWVNVGMNEGRQDWFEGDRNAIDYHICLLSILKQYYWMLQ